MQLLLLSVCIAFLTASCTQNKSKEQQTKDTVVHSVTSPETMSEGERNEISKEVIAIEDEWAKVIGSHDCSLLDRILSPDFIGIGMENGVVTTLTKNEMIAGYKSFPDTIASGINSEVTAHVYTKNTAVVRGYVTEKGKFRSGKDLYRKWYWTDTYVKRKGAWQCVSNYSARLK
jgi:hypothetical protein